MREAGVLCCIMTRRNAALYALSHRVQHDTDLKLNFLKLVVDRS